MHGSGTYGKCQLTEISRRAIYIIVKTVTTVSVPLQVLHIISKSFKVDTLVLALHHFTSVHTVENGQLL